MPNQKIKVIKKEEVKAIKSVENTPISENRSARKAAREMVTTVSSWVNEFQSKKREEAKIGFESLFAPKTQPTKL